LPITLTTASQPETPKSPRLRPALAYIRSPLAVAGVIVAALSSASFRMVGPIYGQEMGLTAVQIAWFLASFVIGGAIAQIPVGWIADKFDRRKVLIWLSVAAIGSCFVTMQTAGMGVNGILLSSALFGLTTFPIYSVAAAHAHDFASSDERVELSAALMFWFAMGAIAAPYGASVLIDSYGPESMFIMLAVGHGVLIVFGIIRMRAGRSPRTRTRYINALRTSFVIGRLTGRIRDKPPKE
jgi:MFS family permease